MLGGRNDLSGFQEAHLTKTFGVRYRNAEFHFITHAGHYPMQEKPIYVASLVEGVLEGHQ